MVNTAQWPDYVQDQVPNEKFSSQYSSKYVYIALLLNRVFLSMNLQQKNLHGKNGSVTSIVLNLVSSMTFADVVKNNVFMSKKDKNTPLVAVQGRSQQCKPPQLIKEVSGKTQMAHLTMERKDSFVKNNICCWFSL